MKYQILKNEKRFFEVKNETIGGFCLSFTTNLATLVPLNLSNCRINVFETLDGKKSAQLLPSMSLHDLHQIQFCNNDFLSQKTFEIKREMAIDSGYFQFKYMFGTPLNLKDGKALWVEIENNDATVTTTTFNINFETVPVIGLQKFIPIVERYDLDSLRAEQDLSLGNNVSNAVYIPNPSETNGNIKDIDIKSDKLNAQVSGYGVYSQLQETTEPITAYDNTSIYLLNSHIPLNSVEMRIVSGQAYANRKIYVVRSLVTPEIANIYMMKSQEHREENLQAISSTSCDCNH